MIKPICVLTTEKFINKFKGKSENLFWRIPFVCDTKQSNIILNRFQIDLDKLLNLSSLFFSGDVPVLVFHSI